MTALLLRDLKLSVRAGGGALIGVALALAGLLGLFLFLTYYFQVVRGWSPAQAGLAFLPLTAGTQAGAFLASRLVPRVPPRALMVPGFVVGAAGMLMLTGLGQGTSYPGWILPAELILGAGVAAVMVPASSTATASAA